MWSRLGDKSCRFPVAFLFLALTETPGCIYVFLETVNVLTRIQAATFNFTEIRIPCIAVSRLIFFRCLLMWQYFR